MGRIQMHIYYSVKTMGEDRNRAEKLRGGTKRGGGRGPHVREEGMNSTVSRNWVQAGNFVRFS